MAPSEEYGAVAPVHRSNKAGDKKQSSAMVAGVISVAAFFAVLALAAHSWPSAEVSRWNRGGSLAVP